MDQKLHSDSTYGLSSKFDIQEADCVDLLNSLEPGHSYPDGQKGHPLRNGFQIQLLNLEHGLYQKSDAERISLIGPSSGHSLQSLGCDMRMINALKTPYPSEEQSRIIFVVYVQ